MRVFSEYHSSKLIIEYIRKWREIDIEERFWGGGVEEELGWGKAFYIWLFRNYNGTYRAKLVSYLSLVYMFPQNEPKCRNGVEEQEEMIKVQLSVQVNDTVE